MSTDVEEAFAPVLPSARRRERDLDSDELRGDEDGGILREGRTSFFCLEAGRISSRSTGTPRETRNRRRVRERIQSGGARGGGATSCDHRDAERSVVKTEGDLDEGGGKSGKLRFSAGKRLAR